MFLGLCRPRRLPDFLWNPNIPEEQEVLIAATRKEKVADRYAVAENAGLKPLVMDVESFAQMSALQLNAGYPHLSDYLDDTGKVFTVSPKSYAAYGLAGPGSANTFVDTFTSGPTCNGGRWRIAVDPPSRPKSAGASSLCNRHSFNSRGLHLACVNAHIVAAPFEAVAKPGLHPQGGQHRIADDPCDRRPP